MKVIALFLALMLLSPETRAAGFGPTKVCKAAIAAIMGQKPSIIKSKYKDGIDYLSYVRDDGTKWVYRCDLQANKILWASETGRWRTDENISYLVSPNQAEVTITQIFEDGSELVNTYSEADF